MRNYLIVLGIVLLLSGPLCAQQDDAGLAKPAKDEVTAPTQTKEAVPSTEVKKNEPVVAATNNEQLPKVDSSTAPKDVAEKPVLPGDQLKAEVPAVPTEVKAPAVTSEIPTEVKKEAPAATPEMPTEVKKEELPKPETPKEVAPEIEKAPEEKKPEVTVPVTPPIKIEKPVHAVEKIPQAPTPEVVQPTIAEVEQGEIVDIDTIDLAEPKGNWLLKRQWWERAEAIYQKIKQQVEQIFETRPGFDNQRTELERKVFAPFYQQVGIGQGELKEILSDLSRQVEQHEKNKTPATEQEEHNLIFKLALEKENLNKLQHDIELVVNYDYAIEDALIKLREQMNLARSYEKQAWNNFKEIARELSDRKAYELFYAMKGFSKNVANINDYIKNPFAQYFMELVKKVKDQVEIIKTSVQGLKEKGIDLKLEADKIEMQARSKYQAQACVIENRKKKPSKVFSLKWAAGLHGHFS